MKPKKVSQYKREDSNLLTSADVLVLLNISRSTLDLWMQSDAIRPLCKIGGTLYFSKKDLNTKFNGQLFAEK